MISLSFSCNAWAAASRKSAPGFPVFASPTCFFIQPSSNEWVRLSSFAIELVIVHQT